MQDEALAADTTERRDVVVKRSDEPPGWVVKTERLLAGGWHEDGCQTIILDANWYGPVGVGYKVIALAPAKDGRPLFDALEPFPDGPGPTMWQGQIVVTTKRS